MAQQSTLEFLVAAQVTGQEQIARLINDTDKLNKTTKGLQSAFAQMGGAARSLSEVQKNAAAIDAARAEKIARLSQEFYNNALAIDRNAKSARDSASVFEEAFQAQEMAAQAQRDAAAAADQLRARLDPMIPIQNRFNAEMDRASDLLRMGAISQKEYAQATTLARQNLYSAQQALHGMNAAQSGVIVNGVRYNSMADYQSRVLRNQRQGVQQLGMQFNDLATSIATGANPITAFNQQIGQVGIAMAQMEGKMGAVGQFLIGPWGTALTIATMALGFLAEKFLFADENAKKAKASITSLADSFDYAKMSAEDLQAVTDLLNKANREVARTAIQAANATAAKADSDANAAQQALNLAKAELFKLRIQRMMMKASEPYTGRDLEQGAFALRMQNDAIARQDALISTLTAQINGFQIESRRATAQSYALAAGMDESAAASERYYQTLNRLQNMRAEDRISRQDYERQVQDAVSAYRKTQDQIAASNKKDRKSRGLTEAQKEAKKLAEATTRYYANAQGKFVEEYQGYRIMMMKSDQEWADRLSALDDETFRNSLDRAAEMAKGIGYISQAAGEDISNFFQKPYEELQNSFQAIGNSVADAFKGMLTGATSWKDGMKSIISAVIDQLWQLYVVQQIVGFVTKALGSLGAPNPAAASTAAANIITVNPNAIASAFTPKAVGGYVGAQKPYLVGERGPELFVPGGSGTIIPNKNMGGGNGGGVTVNVDARGSADPAAVRAQVEAGIIQAAPAIIAAAQQRTVSSLRRPKLGGAIQ